MLFCMYCTYTVSTQCEHSYSCSVYRVPGGGYYAYLYSILLSPERAVPRPGPTPHTLSGQCAAELFSCLFSGRLVSHVAEPRGLRGGQYVKFLAQLGPSVK